MPDRNVGINLIGEEQMEHTPVGRIVSWAVTYGRYIMIGTEVVVLLAFISRFSLDRKLSDLNDEINQKQAIIEANQDFEAQFRTLQNQVQNIQKLESAPAHLTDALNSIQNVLPADAHLSTLSIDTTKLSANAVAGTSLGFSALISNLQSSTAFSSVDIGDIHRDPIQGTQFQFTANLAN